MSLSKKTIKRCILASFVSLFWLFPPADLCLGTLLMLSSPSCQLQLKSQISPSGFGEKNTARRRELQTNAKVSLCLLDMYTCNCLLTCDGQKPSGIFIHPVLFALYRTLSRISEGEYFNRLPTFCKRLCRSS